MAAGITGIIVAGGKSVRMGEDKAFINFSGRPLIETVIDTLSPVFDDLMIITNAPRRYEKYGIRLEGDIIKDTGPLGGIYTALVCSESVGNFIVACDMPFLNRELIKYICEEAKDHDIVVCERNRRLEPLCAYYSKSCISPIKDQLDKQDRKIVGLFSKVKARVIEEAEVAQFDPGGRCFMNVNTPEDHRSAM